MHTAILYVPITFQNPIAIKELKRLKVVLDAIKDQVCIHCSYICVVKLCVHLRGLHVCPGLVNQY